MRLGADPEVFLHNGKKHVSVIGHIGATKWKPLQIANMPAGFTLQEDNVALEFGIPPADSEDAFVFNIQSVIEKGLQKLPGFSFSQLSATIFHYTEMQHALAHEFGCEPDFNAWTKEINPRPKPPHKFMRSAGGHVHIETRLEPTLVVRACDLYLGVPSVLLDNGTQRRQIYGKAGAFRPKPYGAEYRTLSNFWIFEENLIRWVWRNTKQALDFVIEEDPTGKILEHFGPIIQDVINTGNKSKAKRLLKEANIHVSI